jgi:uncharacterized protein YrrD
MLRTVNKLDHCRIIASDGEIGSISDVYFDDEKWVVRYLVVDTGGWLNDRRVLISPYAVRFIDWDMRAVVVDLTRDQVRSSPGIDTDKPVSRQQEEEYHRYYGYPQYWPYATYWAWGAIPLAVPPDPQVHTEAEKARREHARSIGADVHLRSSRAVQGYHIETTDNAIGHVADFLFDEETWAIRYLIADTRNWLPGKHVLLAPQWIRSVSWADRSLSVALSRREVEQSPQYDPDHPRSIGAADDKHEDSSLVRNDAGS